MEPAITDNNTSQCDGYTAATGGASTDESYALAPKREKALMICCDKPRHIAMMLLDMEGCDLTLLIPPSQEGLWVEYPTCVHRDASGRPCETFDSANVAPDELSMLRAEKFDTVYISRGGRLPWNGWLPERLAAAVAKRLVVVYGDGRRRIYEGEDLHRITYNLAYLDMMFRFAPALKGKRALEVGCSDGLACDLLLSEDPEHLCGVDVLPDPGARFTDPRITCSRMDASRLEFPDASFDLCYSIAVLEHCREPRRVLEEMLRVTRPGGYVYVQAGPLYFSPFGHHMFGYFDKYPWIHLLLTPDEIIQGAVADGIGERIRAATGLDPAVYIRSMLNVEHINGKLLGEYELKEFASTDRIEVLHFAISREGGNLLTPEILRQLDGIGRENLTAHGFELVFRVV